MQFHDISELYTRIELTEADNALEFWPSPVRDKTREIYTNVSAPEDTVMITSPFDTEDFKHPICLRSVRGPTQLQTRLTNVALAGALGRGGTAPIAQAKKEQDLFDWFSQQLGQAPHWIFRVIYFPDYGDQKMFPPTERAFGIQLASEFAFLDIDHSNEICLVGALKSIGEHLVAPCSRPNVLTGQLHSVTAYKERLTICHLAPHE